MGLPQVSWGARVKPWSSSEDCGHPDICCPSVVGSVGNVWYGLWGLVLNLKGVLVASKEGAVVPAFCAVCVHFQMLLAMVLVSGVV
jgi:hypothetical protein